MCGVSVVTGTLIELRSLWVVCLCLVTRVRDCSCQCELQVRTGHCCFRGQVLLQSEFSPRERKLRNVVEHSGQCNLKAHRASTAWNPRLTVGQNSNTQQPAALRQTFLTVLQTQVGTLSSQKPPLINTKS